MTAPRLDIDLDKIEHNARAVVAQCAARGIAVAGVTKGVCGHPEVAQAMLRGGVAAIADSRLDNVDRLRRGGVEAPIMLIRVPAPSEAERVVRSVDLSLNSELATLTALSGAADRIGRGHEVVVMVDLGDLREGVWPDDLPAFVGRVLALPGVRLKGIGANLGCFAGAVPDEGRMARLVALADDVESRFGIRLELISAVNSGGLPLLAAGGMSARVNHARIGEAILLGRETTHRRPWPGTRQDAFTLRAEVVELKRKPSAPSGPLGEDAFGGHPRFEDRGDILSALLNLGREDVDVRGLHPADARLSVRGASGGYLALDATSAAGSIRVGDEVRFDVGYGAMLAAMTSGYVEKRTLRNAP